MANSNNKKQVLLYCFKASNAKKKRITSSDLASFVTFTPIYSLLAFLAYSFCLCAIWMDRFGMSLMSLFVDKG